MRSRRILLAAFAVAVVIAGCSDRTSQRIVNTPPPGAFTLTGRLRLVQELFGISWLDTLGIERVENASGILVRIAGPGGWTDSTTTLDGGFEFHVDDPGLYRVSCALFPPETLSTASVTVVDSDVSFPDTLVCDYSRTVQSYPNPFEHVEGLAIGAPMPTVADVRLTILNARGVPVRTETFADHPAVDFHYHWHGDNASGQDQPSGVYWIAIEIGGVRHLESVRKH